jgi:hypothetical protein
VCFSILLMGLSNEINKNLQGLRPYKLGKLSIFLLQNINTIPIWLIQILP